MSLNKLLLNRKLTREQDLKRRNETKNKMIEEFCKIGPTTEEEAKKYGEMIDRETLPYGGKKLSLEEKKIWKEKQEEKSRQNKNSMNDLLRRNGATEKEIQENDAKLEREFSLTMKRK